MKTKLARIFGTPFKQFQEKVYFSEFWDFKNQIS